MEHQAQVDRLTSAIMIISTDAGRAHIRRNEKSDRQRRDKRKRMDSTAGVFSELGMRDYAQPGLEFSLSQTIRIFLESRMHLIKASTKRTQFICLRVPTDALFSSLSGSIFHASKKEFRETDLDGNEHCTYAR